MNILIVGCGKIGSTILASLVNEGHNVTALDSNPDVLSQLTNIYDVMSVCGNGADCETLEEAKVNDADLLIAATDSDEFNMLTCFLGKRMGAKNTIARIRNPQYNDSSLGFMKQQLDLSLSINPELMAARELYHLLKLPSAAKVETFSVRNFQIVELKLKADSVLDGMKLYELRSKFNAKFLICAVERGDEVYIPDGNFILKSGDRIALTANQSEFSKLLKEMGILQKQARRVMILGGSRTAYYLAKLLSQGGNKVTLIERNKEICEELCDAIPKATIINGDGSNVELLLEEGLDSLDAFVALTGIDEENILLSSFATNKNVPKVIAKVNRDELMPLATQWGLDCLISPKKIISDIILRYVRALENSADSNVETLYKMLDDKVEVLEFRVKPDFLQLGICFKDLKTKPNTLIAGIIRERKTIIPTGDDMLLAGDKVVVIAANERINTLSDILK